MSQSAESVATQMRPKMISMQRLKTGQEHAHDVQSQMHNIRRREINDERLVSSPGECSNLFVQPLGWWLRACVPAVNGLCGRPPAFEPLSMFSMHRIEPRMIRKAGDRPKSSSGFPQWLSANK